MGFNFSHNHNVHNCNVKLTWLTELGVTVKCEWGVRGFLRRPLRLYRCHILVFEFCGLYAVRRTQKRGLYLPFSSCAFQLQVTFLLCNADRSRGELFVPRRSRRTPNKTIGHGLKDCLQSENTKTFWKKVHVCSVSPRSNIHDFWHLTRIL